MPSFRTWHAAQTDAADLKKKILINQCPDPLMWYSDKVGETVPYCGEEDGTYWSREDTGPRNIVRKQDATIVYE